MAYNWNLGFYVEEDYDLSNTSYVSPGWGGQEYDVERLGMYEDETRVYFGLQTGFDLSDGLVDNNYAGDFALDTDRNGTYDHAIDILYSSSGFNGMALYSGGTWQDPDYFGISGKPDATYGLYPFQMNSGWTPIGDIDDEALSTEKDGWGNSTHILTGSFLKSDIVGYDGLGMEISWTMQCGNDVLKYKTEYSVPEPATMLLLGTGLIGLAAFGRKRVFK